MINASSLTLELRKIVVMFDRTGSNVQVITEYCLLDTLYKCHLILQQYSKLGNRALPYRDEESKTLFSANQGQSKDSNPGLCNSDCMLLFLYINTYNLCFGWDGLV